MNLNQVDFAKKLGIRQGLYSKYETGALKISGEVTTKLFQLGINLNWLETGEGSMYIQPAIAVSKEINLETDSLIQIKIAAEIAAGPPVRAFEGIDYGMVSVPKRLLVRPGPYYAFLVNGRSMEPEIRHGDYVIISGNWKGLHLNGQICAFRTEDGITLKKLVLDTKVKRGFLIPLNHQFEIQTYQNDSSDIQLIGILIMLWRIFEV